MEPLKLMCVSNEHQTHPDMPVIPVGERVTAIDEYKRDHREYWQLQGFEGPYFENWYHKADFATLPDPSEEVAIEQEREALIYQR